MISYQEALNILHVQAIKFLPQTESCELGMSIGSVLAETVFAKENSPLCNTSAMDGYALTTKSDFGKTFRIVGELAAGDKADRQFVGQNEAIKIMTGAAVPQCCDAIIKVEEGSEYSAEGQLFVRFEKIPKDLENIRQKGEDIKSGQTLIEVGTKIRMNHLLALANQGFSQIKVLRRPKVGIVSTGKELVDIFAENIEAGMVRNSSGIYLETYLKESKFLVQNCGVIEDNVVQYRRELEKLFSDNCDIVLSTGAVSMGKYDFVKEVLQAMGAEIHFHKCAIRPAKPILFATLEWNGTTKYIFGLPGNPISSVVGFRFFVKPFLKKILKEKEETIKKATVTNSVKKPPGLTCFYKAKLSEDGDRVEILDRQASFMVSSFLNANAWAILEGEQNMVSAQEQIEVVSL